MRQYAKRLTTLKVWPEGTNSRARKGRIRWVKAFDACPRNVRLSLAGYIPNVIAGLAAAVKAMTADLEASISSIEAIEIES